jgi:hypothetical protein
MSAFARANAPEVTAVDPLRKLRGQVCAFTRHPTAVATAIGYLMTLHLPGYVHKVAEVLVTHCDRQGIYWGKTTGEIHRLTGVSPKRIQVAGRILRRLGLVEWKWVKHGQRYPRRRSYQEPVQFRTGDRAGYGGRVWSLQWEKLGVRWQSRKVGKELAVSDPTGSLMSDPMGSLLRSSVSSSKRLTVDPALAERASAAPAAPAPVTAAPLAPLAARETKASETPHFVPGSRASPLGPDPRPETKPFKPETKPELKGERAVPLGQAPAEVTGALAALFPATFRPRAPKTPQDAPSAGEGGKPPSPD